MAVSNTQMQSAGECQWLDPSAVESLAKIMSGSDIHDLLGDLERDIRERLNRLAEVQVAEGSLQMIAQDSHDLKSMGGNFGLMELAALAGPVERAARDGNLEAVRADVPRMLIVGQRSLEALSDHQRKFDARAS